MSAGELYPLVVGEVGKPLQGAIGSTLADVWQGIIGDRVAAWRMRNALALNEKMSVHMKISGNTINLAKIPERFAFAWFQSATQSDEAEIQDIYVKILSNAADGNSDALKRRNIDVISRFGPPEAMLFEYFSDRYRNYFRFGHPYESFKVDVDADFFKGVGGNRFEALDALTAMGVIKIDYTYKLRNKDLTIVIEQNPHTGEMNESSLIYTKSYSFSSIGTSLFRALYGDA